jgi:LAO/AO transport system kinase
VAELFHSLDTSGATSHRIAITGTPGVGKSTFIERLGLHYIEHGHRVAVLAVDPSSQVNQGSILGDKTRMEELSRRDEAFIRPSPASDTLGGVTRSTRETIRLCEAGGYDRILIETVGVGQSEVSVKGMVDTFLLLLAGGGGDELQGIKRGVMEMADLLLINKADGHMLDAARHTASDYRAALHLLSGQAEAWQVQVLLLSALDGHGFAEVCHRIAEHRDFLLQDDMLIERRRQQDLQWYQEAVDAAILWHIKHDEAHRGHIASLADAVVKGEMDALNASEEVLKKLGFRD